MTRQEILAVAKPILFNTEIVRAILDGSKMVTRRIIKPQPTEGVSGYWHLTKGGHHFVLQGLIGERRDGSNMYPYGVEQFMEMHALYQAGDYLYVRETWAKLDNYYFYKAGHELLVDGEPLIKTWKPSIHMPKEAAQTFLRVTKVRAERLQEINGSDIEKEGIKTGITHFKSPFNNFGNKYRFQEAVKEFFRLWNSNIKTADLPVYGWEANPWVWVIEFERITPEEVH